jgi:hypothetical protein
VSTTRVCASSSHSPVLERVRAVPMRAPEGRQ